MKKLLWTSISLFAGLSLVLLFISATTPTAQAAQPAQTDGSDPEPAITLPQTDTGYTPEAVEAVLQPAWTSPNSDFTNQLAWGDYDQDGDLDLLTGNSGENRLYQNDGNPTFPTLTEVDTLVCQTPASNTTQSIEWGDYDQDGDLDIAIGNSNNRNCVLQNNNGSFNLAWLSDVILDTRSVAFAGWEHNNEFSMYLAIGNGSEPTNVYRFEGGTFDLWWTETSVYATNVVAWGDYDNDGDPDLALGNFGQPNRLYRNDRDTLTFVQNLPNALNTRDLAWGDMNGDGYLDLAQGNGQSLGNADTARVYCSSGSPAFTFTQCWEAAEAVSTFSVSWGDFEGDGDLDLALSSEENGVTRIYENDGGMLGTDPIWDADDDIQNSRAVAWADWNGDGDLEFTIGYLDEPTTIYENTAGVFQSTSYGPSTYDARSAAWGDYDNDGDLDLAVGNSSFAPSLVYENENGVLTLAFTAPVAENTRSVAWGDYDGDGDLDLALGNGATGTGQANRIYENDNGTFVNSPDFFDPSPSNTYAVAWGDFDGDGDLDLASANYESFQPVQIHQNVGGVFTTTLAVGGTSSDLTLDLAAGDFDQDYDLDLVIANDNGPNRVLINDGHAGFTIQTLPEPSGSCFISPGSDTWSVAWADYDGDGDLDIAAGHAGFSGCIQIIESEYFSGSWVFTTAYQSSDTSLDVRAVEWGDWDGDGDFDLAVGISGSFGRRNRIYRNDAGSFTLAWVAPTAEADTTRGLAWGDADNDGDLDLATANGLSPANPNRLYFNNWKQTSNLPNDPIQAEILRPEATGNAYFFSTAEIQGQPTIYVPFSLSDDEGDPAYLVEFQVSWDGGGNWEPACSVGEDCNFPSGVWYDVPTFNNGEKALYFFQWDALYQLLAHQDLTLSYDDGQFVPNAQSNEEMDVAFRVVPYSNPYHGGVVQRPEFGGTSTLNR
ncbi:MAG TPA: VCBS repeat-containing protein, partial [Anaerolineales bacterium]|nr:VCBS repeat-containing protein [Anaerolineales bacterium]